MTDEVIYKGMTAAELRALPMIEFEAAFNCKPGDKKKVHRQPFRSTSIYWIKFTTPNHSEDDLRFFPGGFPFITNIDLSIWDGDTMLYERPGTNRRHLSCFVNIVNEDPRMGQKSGHPYIPPAKAREEWLKPNHTYYLLVYRPRHDDNQPVGLYYYGNDVDQVDYADVPMPEEPPVIMPDDAEGLSLVIEGRPGLWFETPN